MRGNLPAAQAEFEQQAGVAPDYAPTYFELGMIAMERNNSPMAVAMFERSRELDSRPPLGRNIPVKSAETRLMLARLYSAAGRRADAQRMLDEAYALRGASDVHPASGAPIAPEAD
jgi:tetratricopeptide (TPR) repeat protein